jgi:SAM-dependent methyltransferase
MNLGLAPSQPATALWRAVEMQHLLASGLLPRSGRGLDLGCGDGGVTALVRQEARADWRLVGVDSDPAEAELARGSGLYESVVEADVSSTGLPDASFDFVFSNSVLEHVGALDAALREVGRVLRPGGELVFTVPSEFFPRNLGTPGLLGRLATGAGDVGAYRREIDRRLAHRRYPSVEQWRSALGEAGLELVAASYYMARTVTRRWAVISNATAGLLVRLAGRGSRPIELQRRLGLRRATPPPFWLRGVGRAIGELGALGAADDDGGATRGSCVLILARKDGA